MTLAALLLLLLQQLVGSATAQTTASSSEPVPSPTPDPSRVDPLYPPARAQQESYRNTTQYSHGNRFMFTVHIEASVPTTASLPSNSVLYRRAVFYPTVDRLARLIVLGSSEQIGSLYKNISVFFEVGDGIFGGFPKPPDRRIWRQGDYWNRYWEFLIFADCLKAPAEGTTDDLKCGTVFAADVSDDGCGVGCTDIACLDPAPVIVPTTPAPGATTTEPTTTEPTTTSTSGSRPGRRCFVTQQRDLTVFVGWAGTSLTKTAFTSRKDLPSTYQLYAFGDLGSAVNDEFTLFG